MKLHPRNIALIAITAAIPIAACAIWLHPAHQPELLERLYVPAFVLAVALSSHSPDAVSVWTSSITYTLSILLIAVVLYAIALEFYLLRAGVSTIRRAALSGSLENINTRRTFENLGFSVHQVESARRSHWVLNEQTTVDLTESHLARGAKLFAHGPGNKTEKTLLRTVGQALASKLGDAAASSEMSRLTSAAATYVRSRL